jgi:hypothetical protein
MFPIQHQALPEYPILLSGQNDPYRLISQIQKHSLACAEADMATSVATVKARITFIFIGLSWAQVARMQMLPLKMPGCYNFYVIIT